ncbi:MAG: MTAP family purine nucleoside phosphorylase [Candidatus Diapherotrites archaeon]|nr:MTAP family purine nucleoside phosphorylase [Candidatus Diapherotrites archaeon]
MLGVLGGTVFAKKEGFKFKCERTLRTPYGKVLVKFASDFAFIQRHGTPKRPPHKINHRANIYAFKKLGIKEILGVNSAGSLKKSVKPGSLVVPHDFMQFFPKTFFDDKIVHITPKLSERLRKKIINACRRLRIPVIKRAVYFQTIGPRLETIAEVRFLGKFADIVGMTLADEATLAIEQGLSYASLCTVDNYAHGIANSLSYEEIVRNASKNVDKIKKIIMEMISDDNTY